MRLGFYKYHGTANDFILFDGRTFPLPEEELGQLTPALCHRHTGIGADGTILVIPWGRNGVDLRMVYFNADGSRAEMCGNGIRCLAKFAYDYGLVDKRELVVETLAGPIRLWLEVEKGEVKMVKVEMGVPQFGPRAVRAREVEQGEGSGRIKLSSPGGEVELTLVGLGNPHAVSFHSEITDELVRGVGPHLEKHSIFPNGINVEFVRTHSPHLIEVRVWERGVGETMACGTGACASAVAAIASKKASSPLTVRLPGGDLLVEWEGEGKSVYLVGPAREVFRGEFEIAALTTR